MDYVENDLVVVYLSTQDRNQKDCKFKVCKVLSVGMYDLHCETMDTFNRVFKVSKLRCTKLERKNFRFDKHHPTPPKIGDLVTSIRDSYSTGRESFTGIVENITYDPTSQQEPIYVVRIGQKTVRAYLENIIILESAD